MSFKVKINNPNLKYKLIWHDCIKSVRIPSFFLIWTRKTSNTEYISLKKIMKRKISEIILLMILGDLVQHFIVVESYYVSVNITIKCWFETFTLHKKWSFRLRIYGFGHIYWRNPYWKTAVLWLWNATTDWFSLNNDSLICLAINDYDSENNTVVIATKSSN